MKLSAALASSLLFGLAQAQCLNIAGCIPLDVQFSSNSLVECGPPTTLTWGEVPQAANVTITAYRVTVNALWPKSQDQLVPDTTLGNYDVISNNITTFDLSAERTWTLNTSYPAGTVLYANVQGVAGPSQNVVGAGNLTIGAATSSNPSCVPKEHTPVIINTQSLTNVSQCATIPLSWTGGFPPYNVTLDVANALTGFGAEGNYIGGYRIIATDLPTPFFNWTVDYQAGIRLGLSVNSGTERVPTAEVRRFPIGQNTTSCAIPELNRLAQPVSSARSMLQTMSLPVVLLGAVSWSFM